MPPDFVSSRLVLRCVPNKLPVCLTHIPSALLAALVTDCLLLPSYTGTPGFPMTLSRSPSPVPGGGWSSPGLNISTSGRSSPAAPAFTGFVNGHQPSSWESSSRTKKMGERTYPAFETQNQGFFQRHMRRISNNLPRFNTSTHYAEKEKLQRGRWAAATQSVPWLGRLKHMAGRMGRKSKLCLLGVSLLLLAVWTFFHSRTLVPAFGVGADN